MCNSAKNNTLGKDQIHVEFETEGKMRIETGNMAGVNHRTADQFIALIAQNLGVEPEEIKVEVGHSHDHEHDHSHDHDHE